MVNPNSIEKLYGWENMDRDILAKIFGMLNLVDRTMKASRVCVSWFLASHNPILWKGINFDLYKLITFDHPYKKDIPVYDIEECKYDLRSVLSEITKFCGTTPTNLVYDFYYSIHEEDLTIITPRIFMNIRKFVLPLWRNLNDSSLELVFSQLKNLETLIISQPCLPTTVVNFRPIGDNCKKLTNLKLIRPITKDLADQIVSNFTNLKRISFQCAAVSKNGLLSLINDHPNLKILNLSHCLYMEMDGDEVSSDMDMIPNENLVQIATKKLDTFIACSKGCKICDELLALSLRDRDDDNLFYTFHDDHWTTDEIKEFQF